MEKPKTSTQVLTFVFLDDFGVAAPYENGEILEAYQWEAFKRYGDAFYSALDAESVPLELLAANRALESRSPLKTRPNGYVYFLKGEHGYCKIGRAADLDSRIKTLKIQLPFRVELFHSIATPRPVELEASLHRRYSEKRANGEWFKLDEADFASIQQLGPEPGVAETMAVAAPEMVGFAKYAFIQSAGLVPVPTADGLRFTDLHGRHVDERMVPVGSHGETIREIASGERCEWCGMGVYGVRDDEDGDAN